MSFNTFVLAAVHEIKLDTFKYKDASVMFAVCSTLLWCVHEPRCLIWTAGTLTFICAERRGRRCMTATETFRMQESRTDWVSVCQEQPPPRSHAIIITHCKPRIVYLPNGSLFVFAANFRLLKFMTVRFKTCFFFLVRKAKGESCFTACVLQSNHTEWIR